MISILLIHAQVLAGGYSGVFCKHQVAVKDAFNVYFKPTFPTLDASDKELYYDIASGRINVPEGFYGLSEGNNKQQLKQSIIAEDVSEPGKISRKMLHLLKIFLLQISTTLGSG